MSNNKIDPEVRDRIIRARVQMLIQEPFYGNLATRLIMVKADDWLPTAATDGKHLYYNEEFFRGMAEENIQFVIAHEVHHCLYEHIHRRGSRDPKLWNYANDYVINLELQDYGIGKMPKKITIEGKEMDFTGCIDEKFRGMSSDQVYELLVEEKKKGKERKFGNSLDEHIDPEAKENNKDCNGGNGSSGPIPMTPEERETIRDQIRDAMVNAAKAAGMEKTPASIRALIDDFENPKMDWKELLQQHIQSQVKNDYTFSRPNRKTQAMGIVLPGMKNQETVEVAVAIDTSGSISNEMVKTFLSEVKGIMDQFDDYKVDIWCFDTSIHNYRQYTLDDGDEIMEYEPGGGGGTSFDVNWTFMKENDIEPKRLVMFTDGYTGDGWGDPAYCETLFVIVGGGNMEAPHGMTVQYDD